MVNGLYSLWLQVYESNLFINKQVGKSVSVVMEFGEVLDCDSEVNTGGSSFSLNSCLSVSLITVSGPVSSLSQFHPFLLESRLCLSASPISVSVPLSLLDASFICLIFASVCQSATFISVSVPVSSLSQC